MQRQRETLLSENLRAKEGNIEYAVAFQIDMASHQEQGQGPHTIAEADQQRRGARFPRRNLKNPQPECRLAKVDKTASAKGKTIQDGPVPGENSAQEGGSYKWDSEAEVQGDARVSNLSERVYVALHQVQN